MNSCCPNWKHGQRAHDSGPHPDGAVLVRYSLDRDGPLNRNSASCRLAHRFALRRATESGVPTDRSQRATAHSDASRGAGSPAREVRIGKTDRDRRQRVDRWRRHHFAGCHHRSQQHHRRRRYCDPRRACRHACGRKPGAHRALHMKRRQEEAPPKMDKERSP
jgi:hypothetical protein